MKKITIAATGFPGRPMNGLFLISPNANGLPGLIASLQNFILPCSFKNFPIISVLLLDTPPLVTRISIRFSLLKIFFFVCRYDYPFFTIKMNTV